jgi:hypothetical protein
VTIIGDDVLDTIIPDETLNHRDIEPAVTGPFARSDLTNLLRF